MPNSVSTLPSSRQSDLRQARLWSNTDLQTRGREGCPRDQQCCHGLCPKENDYGNGTCSNAGDVWSWRSWKDPASIGPAGKTELCCRRQEASGRHFICWAGKEDDWRCQNCFSVLGRRNEMGTLLPRALAYPSTPASARMGGSGCQWSPPSSWRSTWSREEWQLTCLGLLPFTGADSLPLCCLLLIVKWMAFSLKSSNLQWFVQGFSPTRLGPLPSGRWFPLLGPRLLYFQSAPQPLRATWEPEPPNWVMHGEPWDTLEFLTAFVSKTAV